jgi:hypothetical protein
MEDLCVDANGITRTTPTWFLIAFVTEFENILRIFLEYS